MKDNWINREVVGERKVVLKEIRVKERADQVPTTIQEGIFTTPVHVVARIEIEGVDGLTLWPVSVQEDTVGMWWSSMEGWEKDEDEFKKRLYAEIERLKIVSAEKKGGIGA